MGIDLSPDPVFGLALQVADEEKFPLALGFESLDPFLSQQTQFIFFFSQPYRRMGVTTDFLELKLACEADDVPPLDTV